MKYKLAALLDVPEHKWSEHGISTENGFLSVILKRSSNTFLAFLNACPHQGRRMDYASNQFLETAEGLLVCPAHGATFNAQDGFCTAGPCMGQSLKSFPVSIDGQYVYIEVS